MCDGEKSDTERTEIRRISEDLGSGDPAALSRQILMGRLTLVDLAPRITGEAHRLLAYEMALGVCESDGPLSDRERTFLDGLRAVMNLSASASSEAAREVESVMLAPALLQDQTPPAASAPDNSQMILNYAILNGALELLPETMATIAILPMQMKMVYRIGKSHGVELDRSRITEFLAVAGVGLGSQMVEGFARKFLGGLGKKLGGKLVGKAANQFAGSAISFAATYALGHLAEKYHSGGRRLDTNSARSLFESLKSQATELHARHLPDIQAKASTITPSAILKMVTCSGPA
jgi:uncharacterized protein (DUF697 family)